MIELESGVGEEEEAASAKHATVVEIGLVVVISLTMTILPVLEIILRRVRGSGVPGGSVYVQHLTLWLGFLGALAATAAGKHLGLATANLLPHGRWRVGALVFGSMVSSATCLILAYASYQVVMANRTGTARLAGGIPEWWS